MPSALPRRDVHAVQSWWSPENLLQNRPHSSSSHETTSKHSSASGPPEKQHHTVQSRWKPENLLQNRSHSTATQESRAEDSRASAILHGQRSTSKSQQPTNHDRNQVEQRNLKSNAAPEITVQRLPFRRTSSSQHVSRTMERSRQDRERMQGMKRKAGASDTPPAQRRRQGPAAPVELKDEAYIRRTMHVPTQEDYPMLKTGIFAQLKQSLHNALQDVDFSKNTRPLRGIDAFQCTISCSALELVAIEGEGTSKVISRMISVKPMLILSSPPPKPPHICISLQNFTS